MSSNIFTCVTCGVGFATADGQRLHYKTEWHRYNLKRKVADMKPVSETDFANRVAAQQQRDAAEDAKAKYTGYCEACGKSFATQNSYENHVNSKKHKDNVASGTTKKDKAVAKEQEQQQLKEQQVEQQPIVTWESLQQKQPETETPSDATAKSSTVDMLASQLAKGVVIADEDEEENEAKNAHLRDGTQSELDFADDKIANAKFLSPLDCIFCAHVSESFDANVEHITKKHSFFIPDLEYLVDLPGLVRYLGEKISVGNCCLFCNKVFWTMESVQKHMTDKGHCKLLYEGDAELEVSDFYDFRSSYPDYVEGKDEDDLPEDNSQALIIHDVTDELILPSGMRLGSRTLLRYYKQKFRPAETRESVLINLMSSYKALGWNNEPTLAQRDMTVFLRRKQDWRMKVGVNANRLQKHFRYHIIY